MMAFTDPEYAQFMPNMPTFTTATTAKPRLVSGTASADTQAGDNTTKKKPLLTGLPFGFNLPRPTGVPFQLATQTAAPATQNAAASASEATTGLPAATPPMLYNQSDVRKTEGGASAPQTPSGLGGSTSPNGTGYNAVGTSVAGITRVNSAGASPLFTNLDAGTALDDINKKGGPLPSVPGFLNTVKSGGLGLVSPTATVDPTTSYVGSVRAKSDLLMQQADSIGSSGGLVDMWKARGLRRSANLLSTHADAAANTAVNEQANRLHAQQLGQNYALGLAQIGATQRGQDLNLLPHLPQFNLDTARNTALKSGELDKARDIATVTSGRNIVTPKYTPVHDAAGQVTGFVDDKVGLPSFQPYDAKAYAAEQKKQALSKAAGGQ